MSFRQTIAAKIFGLAVFLLLLTIALAGFLLHEVTRTKQALQVIAQFDLPLTQSVARLDELGLRRRLAFERWFGALNAVEPNQEIITEASANYTLFTRKLADEFAAARRIIGAYPRNLAGPGRETLAEVKTLLDQIEPAYQIISTRQRELLDIQRAGEHEKANQQVARVNSTALFTLRLMEGALDDLLDRRRWNHLTHGQIWFTLSETADGPPDLIEAKSKCP